MTRATCQWSVCRTVFLFLAGISLIGFSLTAYAQPSRLPRIGVVSATAGLQISTPTLDGFREGLRELGYSDGKNIILEYRYAEGSDHCCWCGAASPGRQARNEHDPYCNGECY